MTKTASDIYVSHLQIAYLATIQDWCSPQMVAERMGFRDKRAAGSVSRCLGLLAQRGLAELRREPYEYRITEKGRAIIGSEGNVRKSGW